MHFTDESEPLDESRASEEEEYHDEYDVLCAQ
jgi:hypothetical protein